MQSKDHFKQTKMREFVTSTARNDKENFSNGRKMISDRKLDVQKGIKNAKSDKYVDKYKIVFSPLFLMSLKDHWKKKKDH